MLAGIHQNYGTPVPIVGNLPPASRTAFGGDRRIVGDGVMEEIWKPIAGYEGQYEVSDFGNVRSKDRTDTHGKFWKSQPIKTQLTIKGYVYVFLCKSSKYHPKNVHRLVGEAFLGKKPTGLETNHKDGNKLNNAISNLEYVTHRQNMRHAWSNNLCVSMNGSANHNSKLTEQDVENIRQLRGKMKQVDIAKMYGVHQTVISHVQIGRTWTHVKGNESPRYKNIVRN